jgi:hypothetical protein
VSFAFDARRRRLLLGTAAALAGVPPGIPALGATAPRATPFIEDLERRTFDWFWETTPTANGLTLDRQPSRSPSSIAAVGFGLTAYPIGVERGYIPRDDAIERVLNTLRFFRHAPQGPQEQGVAGYKGFFYHFLDIRSGYRYRNCELSTVDTALLLGGVLFCRSYFDKKTPEENEIRTLADEIYARVDWNWAQVRAPAICHGWTPEKGFIEYDWLGYNEAMLVYILALGAPEHAAGPEAWQAYTATYDRSWGKLYGPAHLTFRPLFGHQYSHVWIDFRGIRDAYMRDRSMDYFENSRLATHAHRAYAIDNPMQWKAYGENVWGLTACDGPADVQRPYRGELRRFRGYSARGVGLDRNIDDGTIAPTAAGGSIAFAPDIVIPALQAMATRFGEQVYGRYGFVDAFNPSFDMAAPLRYGQRVPGFGWVDTDRLGIDQGPILAMIENHRSGLVWRVMRGNPHIRAGLTRAGFTGGWLAPAPTPARRK